MDNHQSTQQLAELDYSEVTQSSRRHTPSNKNFFMAMLRHYPWLIWGGMWVLLLLISIISIISLTHPIGVEQEEPQQKPIAVEKQTKISPQTRSPQTDRTLPLLVLGATVFTLTAGSLVIIKLRYSKRSPKRSLTRRQQRKLMLEAQASSSATQSQPLTPPAPTPDAQPGVTVLPSQKPLDAGVIEVPDDSLPLSATDNLTQDKDSKPEEPLVTVLPPEESDLADPGEELLAEKMDIRKHRSLSSILHDS